MPYTSRRTRFVIVGLAIALVLSLGATAAMAVAWSRDREANRAALANDAQRIHMLQVHASPAVSNSPSASPTPAPTATTAAPTAAPVTTTQATPAAPVNISITHVLDSLGNVWTGMVIGVVHVKTGTVVTISATAEDPLGRKLDYEFWRGDVPTQTLLCGWGGPSCQWTAAPVNPPCEANCGTVDIWIAVRDQDTTHRFPTCFRLEPCDDWRFVTYDPEPF